MKLTEQQTTIIQEKTGLEPLPTEVAAESGLTGHFGDETFYLNSDGIYVFVENQQAEEASEGDASAVTAVKIAAIERDGDDEGQVMVRGVQPQQTGLTVELA